MSIIVRFAMRCALEFSFQMPRPGRMLWDGARHPIRPTSQDGSRSEKSWPGDDGDDEVAAEPATQEPGEQAPLPPPPAHLAPEPLLEPPGDARQAGPPSAPELAGAAPGPPASERSSGGPRAEVVWGQGEATYFVGGRAWVSYYKKGAFQATCQHHLGDCRKTRTNKAPSGWRLAAFPAQGRPVDELVAWLEKAPEFATVAQHAAFSPGVALREQMRERLLSSGGGGSGAPHVFREA